MPSPAERLSLLLNVHGHSYHNAGNLCGIDHTTVMRVARGETENPVSLQKISEGYGVPLSWLRGERDAAMDFACAVLLRPLRERVMLLWQLDRRVAFALGFLREYDPGLYTRKRFADLLDLPESDIAGIMEGEHKPVTLAKLERLSSETGLPITWFRTGLVGREDEEELLVGMAEWALSSLAEAMGLEVTEGEIHQSALALL